jgi:hypothetical protein
MDHNQILQRTPIVIGFVLLGLLILGWGVVRVMSDPWVTGEDIAAEEGGLQWEHRNGNWIIVNADEKGDRVWQGDTEVVPFALLIRPERLAIAGGAITFIVAMLIGARVLFPQAEIQPPPVTGQRGATPSPAEPRQYVAFNPDEQPLDPKISLTRTPAGARPRLSTQTPMPARRLADGRVEIRPPGTPGQGQEEG